MTQPTALFLADILEDAGKPADIAEKCATELRRLHAENEALLEAYRKMKSVAAAYSNFCDDSAFTRKLEREFEAVDAIARAAIKKAEENT